MKRKGEKMKFISILTITISLYKPPIKPKLTYITQFRNLIDIPKYTMLMIINNNNIVINRNFYLIMDEVFLRIRAFYFIKMYKINKN